MAQIVEFSPSDLTGVTYKVNIPSATAKDGSGPIYFQMQAPTSIRWLGMGIGDGMTGAEIFVLYSASDTEVTISPRLGYGHVEPTVNSNVQVTLLEGSGIQNDIMTANFRCENCTTWPLGSIDFQSTSSSMLYSALHGSPINSAEASAEITQHDTQNLWTANLVQATGGDSVNPFAGSSSLNTTSASGASSLDAIETRIKAHATIMGLSFVVLFPCISLTIHLVPSAKTVAFIHGPLQLVTLCLVIAGMGLGISVAKPLYGFNGPHQIIGLVTVSSLVAFQPLMGLLQHLHWRKYHQKAVWAYTHRWFGRTLILLGMINGGLGLWLAGPGTSQAPWGAIISYSVIAGVVAVFYVAVLICKEWGVRRTNSQSKSGQSIELDSR